MKAKVSAELPKFNRIEKALRQAMLDLNEADKEIQTSMGGKRTVTERAGLGSVQERCRIIAGELKKCWEDMFEIADGRTIDR